MTRLGTSLTTTSWTTFLLFIWSWSLSTIYNVDIADGAITYYVDRDQFLAALPSDANIVENVARRTQYNGFAENVALNFTQCDLTFVKGTNSYAPDFIQIRNDLDPQTESFNGADAYLWWTKPLDQNSGMVITTLDSFYAIGFDAVSGNQGPFGIKVFDDTIREYDLNNANTNQPAQFYGWISDEGPVSMMEIGAGPSFTGNLLPFMMTNLIYASTNDASLTQVGCNIVDPATRFCSATGWGDPHMITFDALRFDVHAKGELTFVKSLTSDFEVQGRTEGLGEGTGGPAVTTGIVVKEDSSLNLPTIQVSVAPNENSPDAFMVNNCPISLFVNNQTTNIADGGTLTDARVRVIEDQKVVIEYTTTNMRFDMKVKSYVGKCLFSVDYIFADCRPNDNMIGLLGSPNRIWSDDWMTRDGTVLPIPPEGPQRIFRDAYEYAVDNWCLRSPTESYFSYESNEDFYTYAFCGNAYDPTFEDIVNNPPTELDICNGDLGCLIDGVTLGVEAAVDYLDEPAILRTYAPTEPPTDAPSGPNDPNCEPNDSRQLRQLVDLKEQWSIAIPTFGYNDLAVDLDFDINNFISQTSQVRSTLYLDDCETLYTGNSLDDTVASVFGTASSGNPDRKSIGVSIGIDPSTISTDTGVYQESNIPGNVTADVDFCVRVALHTPSDNPSGADREVNYLEIIVRIDVDLSDGFDVNNVSVERRDPCEVQANDEFLVEGYFCQTGSEWDPSIGQIEPIRQGQQVKICVRPLERGLDLNVRMRRIASFTFTKGQPFIEQVAVENAGPASNGLTELFCTSGYAICHFETILFASFFTNIANITGSGLADLQFGGQASTQSVSPRVQSSRRRLRSLENSNGVTDDQKRKLQTVDDGDSTATAVFDSNCCLRP